MNGDTYMNKRVHKVQLTATTIQKARPIPDKVLSEEEGQEQWPSARFLLFYKKGFKNPTNLTDPELKVYRAWYKPLPSAPWNPVPKSLIDKCDFRVICGSLEDKDNNGNVTECVIYDPPPGMWRLDCEVTVGFQSSSFDLPESEDNIEYEGHARFIAEATTPQSGDLGNPAELHPSWISHFEWSKTPTGLWQKVPEQGERGFPLHVQQPIDIYLRAVKLYPKEPWPTEGYDSMNTGQRLPQWGGKYWNSLFTPDFLSSFASNRALDTLHLQQNEMNWTDSTRVTKGRGIVGSGDNNHLLTVTANAGSDKSAQLFVEPMTATP